MLISYPEIFQTTLAKMIHDGKSRLHVISDFDRTLTKAFVDGKPRSSLESILEGDKLLGEEYSEKSKVNFNKYYPIEMDPNVSLHDKQAAMQAWWTVQFQLMIDSGLSKNIIEQTMQSQQIVFRSGYQAFFNLLRTHNIPLVIFSASGLGYEGIYHGLKSIDFMQNNVHIVSNKFIRNEKGKAIGVHQPIIHSFNKNDTLIHTLPFYPQIVERKNVLLLGDSIGDIGMITGFEYNNIIKIGFYNELKADRLQLYREAFDIVITDDGGMEEINEILQRICGS